MLIILNCCLVLIVLNNLSFFAFVNKIVNSLIVLNNLLSFVLLTKPKGDPKA